MQQTAQVMFFPIKYFPTFLEMEHLRQLQDEIYYCHRKIEHDSQGNRYQIVLRKQLLANRLRESFYIVQNQ